jgi:prepilin-type N-terminal cleavage/methylation domain-containing protein
MITPFTRRRAGFTLVEILVSIGIIVVLISLVVPAIVRARRQAEQAAIKQDLNALGMGLEEYKNNYNQYPQTNVASNPTVLGPKAMFEALASQTWNGSALVAKTDPKSGRKLAPLIQVDRFHVETNGPGTSPGTGTNLGNGVCFRDPDGNPYLYFPALVPKPDINNVNATSGGFVGNWSGTGPAPLYNWRDCSGITSKTNSSLSLADMRYLLGDGKKSPPYTAADSTAAPQNGKIDATETAASTSPYLLWAAGLDSSYGLSASGNKTDDVANFDFPPLYRK